jgi:drug/metabolite transporter (DMT)-like permease
MDADRAPPRRTPRSHAIADRLHGNAYLLLALASLCWSGNHIIGRAVAGHVPPLGVALVRLGVSALILWPFAHRHLVRDWPVIRRHLGTLTWLSLLGGALFAGLQYVGLQYTTALNVSVMNSLAPVLIVAASAAAFGDRLSLAQTAGILISLAGVLVIITRADIHVLAALEFNWGDLLVLIAMVGWAIYCACLRIRPRIHWLSFNFLFSAISAAATLPFFAWEVSSGFAFQTTLLTIGALVYVAIVPSIIAMIAWNRGIELIGANRAGVFLHLVPLFSVALAGLFLGEALMAYHVVGLLLILAGVWLAGRRT